MTVFKFPLYVPVNSRYPLQTAKITRWSADPPELIEVAFHVFNNRDEEKRTQKEINRKLKSQRLASVIHQDPNCQLSPTAQGPCY